MYSYTCSTRNWLIMAMSFTTVLLTPSYVHTHPHTHTHTHPHTQAYFMVHRALTHMLVLPWPETSDSQQQWEERSLELSRLISGSTAIFQQLEQTAGWTQNTQLQQQGACSLINECSLWHTHVILSELL